jgi:hypothetical protein
MLCYGCPSWSIPTFSFSVDDSFRYVKPVSDPPTHILLHNRGQKERLLLLLLDLFDIAESLGLPNVVSR